jgi:hypothetical protein
MIAHRSPHAGQQLLKEQVKQKKKREKRANNYIGPEPCEKSHT